MLAALVDLTGDSLDQSPILRQPFAALLDLFDRSVVFVLHFGDRVIAPDRVGQLLECAAIDFQSLPRIMVDLT